MTAIPNPITQPVDHPLTAPTDTRITLPAHAIDADQLQQDAMVVYFSQEDSDQLMQPNRSLSAIETVDEESIFVLRNINGPLMAFQITPDGKLGEQVDPPGDEDEDNDQDDKAS